MALIQATRPKRRNYTIALFSTDVNSYQSALSTPWQADYYVNLNSIMSQEEQQRPYFVHFTFQSTADAAGVIGTPTTAGPLFVFLDFNHNTYPHMFSNSSYKPNGILKWVPDVSTTPINWYLEAKTIDNEEIYVHSMTGINMVTLSVKNILGQNYTSPTNFTIFIHLVPADF